MAVEFNEGEIVSKELIATQTYQVLFKPRASIYPKPGQYVSVEVENMIFRHYSVSDKNGDLIELLLDTKAGGPGSRFFDDVSIGSKFRFLGPLGQWQLSKTDNSKVFICTGTGVAPFKFMIKTELLSYKPTNLTLFFGTKSCKDIIDFELYKSLQQKNRLRFKYVVCVSQDEIAEKDEEFLRKGRVTDALKVSLPFFEKSAEFYICGSADMIKDVTDILFDGGVTSKQIFLERW